MKDEEDSGNGPLSLFVLFLFILHPSSFILPQGSVDGGKESDCTSPP
jgi:hypothetical protein